MNNLNDVGAVNHCDVRRRIWDFLDDAYTDTHVSSGASVSVSGDGAWKFSLEGDYVGVSWYVLLNGSGAVLAHVSHFSREPIEPLLGAVRAQVIEHDNYGEDTTDIRWYEVT